MIKQGIEFKEQLKSMSLKDLEDMIANAEIVAKSKQIDARQNSINQIMELAAHINMRAELTNLNVKPTRRGLKVEAKYRNPDDVDQTWTGRGIKPVWLRVKLAAGFELSEFLCQRVN